MTKLAKDVSCNTSQVQSDCSASRTSDFDHNLMTCCASKMLEHCGCSVWLEVLVVGDQLDHPVPDFRSNVVSSRRNELQYCVNVPLVLQAISE